VRRRSGGSRKVVNNRGRAEIRVKKEEARKAVLGEYDRWAKKHPNDARMMGGFLFFDTYRKKSRTCSISVRLMMRSGKSFTAGYRIGWATNPEAVCHPVG
jgi:hypothetical protein